MTQGPTKTFSRHTLPPVQHQPVYCPPMATSMARQQQGGTTSRTATTEDREATSARQMAAQQAMLAANLARRP